MLKKDKSCLLTDEQMRCFIVNGYVQVQTDLPDAVHDAVLAKSDAIFDNTRDQQSAFGANPGNNIMPIIPELRQVLEAPEVVGALKSILGPRYLLHPHRHCHPNFPSAKEDTKSESTSVGVQLTMVPHKDGHANGAKPRHRVPRWLILFYYPQDCPQELGPTAIIPRSQYHNVLTRDLDLQYPTFDTTVPVAKLADSGQFLLPDSYIYRSILPLSSARGSVSIMHFDVGHSVLVNLLERTRYGHKFVFMRTENPKEPSWDNHTEYWQTPELVAGTPDNEIVWTSVWNWLRGNPNRYTCQRPVETSVEFLIESLGSKDDMERAHSASELGFSVTGDVALTAKVAKSLCKALYDTYEPVRLNALYSLGGIGPTVLAELMRLLDEGADFFKRNPVLNINHVVDALAGMGEAAVPSLVRALSSSKEHIRASAAYGLGEIGLDLPDVVKSLVEAVNDPENAVIFHAISALGMVGKATKSVVDTLLNVLTSESKETVSEFGERGIIGDSQLKNVAVQALIRINAKTPATTEVLANSAAEGEPYVAAFAGEQLRRIGTTEALSQLTYALSWSRWFPVKNRSRPDLKIFKESRAKSVKVERAKAPVTTV